MAFIIAAIVCLAVGIWIGVGAPGWPYKIEGPRQHTQRRSLNPIAWGRTPKRDRQTPRLPGDRKLNLRR